MSEGSGLERRVTHLQFADFSERITKGHNEEGGEDFFAGGEGKLLREIGRDRWKDKVQSGSLILFGYSWVVSAKELSGCHLAKRRDGQGGKVELQVPPSLLQKLRLKITVWRQCSWRKLRQLPRLEQTLQLQWIGKKELVEVRECQRMPKSKAKRAGSKEAREVTYCFMVCVYITKSFTNNPFLGSSVDAEVEELQQRVSLSNS